MNTSTLKPVEPEATSVEIFSLGLTFLGKVQALHLPGSVVQAAKDQKDHALWSAIREVLVPKPEPVAEEVEVFVPRVEVIHETPKPCIERFVDDQIADFKKMYSELRWTWSESGLVVPERQKGFDRLLVLANTKYTNNTGFDVCQASFPSWRYTDDLDTAVPAKKDQRHPSRGPYAIWVRDSEEPDRDLLGLSANKIAEMGLRVEGLGEYIIHHLVYYRETGRHLDQRTWTLCAGSRASGGDVPFARWLGDRFLVGWCHPDDRYPFIGARQAVTP